MLLMVLAILWLTSSLCAFVMGRIIGKHKAYSVAFEAGRQSMLANKRSVIRAAYRLGYMKGKSEQSPV